MKISTNGKRNITLDFNAPRNFRIVQNGVEIPYLRTGKNSFRLSKKVDGDIEMEEVKEKAKRIKPFSLQSPQMTFISSDDVDRLNSAIEQISLVNPQDVAAINNAVEKIDSSQMYIAEKQQQLEATQTYIDQQQQRLNETALGIQALETDNSQRLDGTENAILNLAGEITNAQNMAVDGMNTALNKIEEQRISLQSEIDTKADKEELETLKKDFEEKSDQFSNAMSSYSGGYAYDTLPRDGEAGQILAKRTDRQGDYIWIDQTPVIVKSETMPTASEKYKGEVYQYVGETGDYTHGYIYECQQNGTSYDWVRLDVQPNTWGQITGTLSDQTDLQDALDLKANKSYVDSQDNNLQQQIDAIVASSDVFDIVGTYAELQAYDISTVPVNDIIKVLVDSTHNDAATYYRCVENNNVKSWSYIGSEGAYYTKSETNTLLSAKQDTLVSGTNIKTINGSSILGSGNLSVAADIDPYITNCITEIPQDIKLELNSNNRPVLKAGSKFYRPNGNGVFDLVSNTSDLTFNFTNTQTGKYFLCVTGNNSAGWAQVGLTGSGTSTEANNGFYYRTDDNKIYYQNNSSGNVYSFPLAIVTATNGVCVIDQVFNGFGYIGSTIFALPGVKGLIPNGRNADGSLKNTVMLVSNVIATTFSGSENQNNVDCVLQGTTFWARNQIVVKSASEIGTSTGNYYIVDENRFVYSSSGTLSNQSRVIVGKITLSSGKVTSLTPKTAFHAVDYNDFKQADDNNVKLTGDQTIAGVKKFIGGLDRQSNSYTWGTTPTSTVYNQVIFRDSTGDYTGYVGSVAFSNGNAQTMINCRNKAKTTSNYIAIGYDASDNVYTYAPTPATSDNSTKIATTAYVNNKFKVVSALPANPDSSTFYFITA